MENFGSPRDEGETGTEEIKKETPKEERKEILETAQDGQGEEVIDNGFGILAKKKTLYHGSGTSGIQKFNKAEEDTVGSGIYFTSQAKNAVGYARRRARSRKEASPVVYEASVENMKLVDLRKEENVKKVLDGFKRILLDELKKPDLRWNHQAVLQNAVDAINSGKAGARNLREVTFSAGQMFSDYVRSLGYEGLIALEGGEGDDIGNHDTYLIFEPDKVKINKETGIV